MPLSSRKKATTGYSKERLKMNLNQIIQNQSYKGPWATHRKNSAQLFLETGLPTKKDEAWKYTSLGLIKTKEFQFAELKETSARKQELESHVISGAITLVYINGHFSKELSNFRNQKGLRLFRSVDVVQKSPQRLKVFRGLRRQVKDLTQDSIEALNAASFQSGVYIEVDPKALLGKTLQLIYLSTEKNAFVPIRNFIHVKSDASLNLVETFVGQDGSGTYTNLVCDVLLEKRASLKWTLLQDESSSAVTTQKRRFFLQSESQVLDSHTMIDHVSGECSTQQLYKYILGGSSRSVFDGFVRIHEGAQKASSEQLNNNLLLSETAEADSKPNLMIYADDVKATHGSTVGRLDEEEIFYLQSRAISKAEARKMLALGFVTELLDYVTQDQLRDFLHTKISAAFQRMES